jgi:hypothetical protein
MYRVVTAVLIGVGSFPASAKCIEAPYQVSGHIKNVMGRPIAGAGISVTWSEHVGGGVKRVVSSANGSYVAAFRSSTLSSDNLTHGDLCEARVASATVEVAEKGYRTKRGVVKFKGGRRRRAMHWSRSDKRSVGRKHDARLSRSRRRACSRHSKTSGGQ